jgi:ABC-type phosphate/phosphonate transport system permease subunit
MSRLITFDRLKYLSFAHSAAYFVLLACWIAPGYEGPKHVLGWVHGIGWIVMSVLCIAAVRLRVIPLWLAVMVAIVGGVGPFAGSVAFVLCQRGREPPERAPRRDMV